MYYVNNNKHQLMNIPIELLYELIGYTDYVTRICLGCTCKDVYKYLMQSREKTVKLENVTEFSTIDNLNILVGMEELNILENIVKNIIDDKLKTKLTFDRYLKNSSITFVNGLIESMVIVYHGDTNNLCSPMIDTIISLTKSLQYSEKLTINLYYDIDDYNNLDYDNIHIIEGKKFIENYSENKKIILTKLNFDISSINFLNKINLPICIHNKLKKLYICKQEEKEYDFRFLSNLEVISFEHNSTIKLSLPKNVNEIFLQNFSITSNLYTTDKIIEWTDRELITNFDDNIVSFTYTKLDPNNLNISKYTNLRGIGILSDIPLNNNFFIPDYIFDGIFSIMSSEHKFIINHTMRYIFYTENSVVLNKYPIVEEFCGIVKNKIQIR